MKQRLIQCWHSFRTLPTWVQIWVGGILVPVNALAFLMLDTTAGLLTAIAAIFVLATNIPIMLLERGMSRLMAVPHLLAWYPLVWVLGSDLLAGNPDQPASSLELTFMTAVIVINSISLAFDTKDTLDWLRGKRDVPGRELSEQGT